MPGAGPYAARIDARDVDDMAEGLADVLAGPYRGWLEAARELRDVAREADPVLADAISAHNPVDLVVGWMRAVGDDVDDRLWAAIAATRLDQVFEPWDEMNDDSDIAD